MQNLFSPFEKILDKSLFWLVLLLLVFIPLYPKFPLVNIAGTFVAIRLEDFIVAFVLGVWLFYIIISGNLRNFFGNKINKALLVFFFVGAVSLFSGVFLTHTVALSFGFLSYLRRIELMMLLPVAYSAIKSKKQIKVALGTLLVVVFLVNIYAFGQQFLHWPVISTTNSEFSKGQILYLAPGARVNSTFAGHYDLAVFLVMALSLMTPIFFYAKNFLQKIIIATGGGLSLIVLAMTAARQSFVAMIFGVIAALYFSSKKKFILLIMILAVIALAVPSPLRDRFISTITVNLENKGQRYSVPTDVTQYGATPLNIPTLQSGYATPSSEATKSASPGAAIASDIAPGEPTNQTDLEVSRSLLIRLNIEWPRAIRALAKNPLLGTGYSSIGVATDNDILRSLAEVGLLGSLAFGMLVLLILKRLFQICRGEDKFISYLSAGVIAMLLAFIVNGLFIDVFEASKVATLLWLILGINLSVEKLKS